MKRIDDYCNVVRRLHPGGRCKEEVMNMTNREKKIRLSGPRLAAAVIAAAAVLGLNGLFFYTMFHKDQAELRVAYSGEGEQSETVPAETEAPAESETSAPETETTAKVNSEETAAAKEPEQTVSPLKPLADDWYAWKNGEEAVYGYEKYSFLSADGEAPVETAQGKLIPGGLLILDNFTILFFEVTSPDVLQSFDASAPKSFFRATAGDASLCFCGGTDGLYRYALVNTGAYWATEEPAEQYELAVSLADGGEFAVTVPERESAPECRYVRTSGESPLRVCVDAFSVELYGDLSLEDWYKKNIVLKYADGSEQTAYCFPGIPEREMTAAGGPGSITAVYFVPEGIDVDALESVEIDGAAYPALESLD